MVARLRDKPGSRGDRRHDRRLRDDDGRGPFSVAYLVFNTIMNLTTQDEQVACFRNVAAHLEPGGCFVIEVCSPTCSGSRPGDDPAVHGHADPLGFDEYDVVGQG